MNRPANLLLVCGSGTTGCHGFIESHRSLALATGWLVSQHVDPADAPVCVARTRWVLLTDDATYQDVPVPAGASSNGDGA